MKTHLKNTLNGIALMLLSILTFSSCDTNQRECPASEVRTFSLSGFNQVDAGENFRITLRQGDEFSIRAEGCTNDLEDLKMEIEGNELAISYRKWYKNRKRMDLDITMPELKGFSFSGAAKATVLSFDETPFIKADLSGAAEATFTGFMEQVDIELSGASDFDLGGAANKMVANLSGSSRLRAYDCAAKIAEVDASGGSKAWVFVEENLKANATGGSNIYYKGNPTTDIQQSGGGKVERQ